MHTISKLKTELVKPVFSMINKPIPITYIGAGKIDSVLDIIQTNQLDNILIITDSVLVSLGLIDPVAKAFESAGIQHHVYDGVKPDPTFDIVNEALEVCRENSCQGLIAFGGGSVIDTAKTVSVAFTNNMEPSRLKGINKAKSPGLPLIAVPTTAGTGSECTIAAVISDPVTHQKATIIDPKIVPNYVILDPELLVGLPPHITSSTAMDALTHAVEAYISKYATDETKRYSRISIKMIYDNLENVYKNPQDLKGREALLLGSFYGGLAFTRAFIGYVHAFAHNIGGKFGIPHGLANAVLLPHVMEFSKSECVSEFSELAMLVGLCGAEESKAVQADKFVKSLFELNSKIGMPERLEKFEKQSIKSIRREAFKECHGNYPVPKYLSSQQAEELLGKVCAV